MLNMKALCWDGVVIDPFLWKGLEWVGELEGGWGGWGVGRGLEGVDGELEGAWSGWAGKLDFEILSPEMRAEQQIAH